ncbi:unnamed protein product [Symbiodinium sp. CCMP2592]|nr:unnamed protein product [Symbiodinium sp. CCMP2592]
MGFASAELAGAGHLPAVSARQCGLRTSTSVSWPRCVVLTVAHGLAKRTAIDGHCSGFGTNAAFGEVFTQRYMCPPLSSASAELSVAVSSRGPARCALRGR